jgi:hypothetical protein
MLTFFRPSVFSLAIILLLGTSCSENSSSNPIASYSPVNADQPNEFPVGREWRERSTWAHPSDFYRESFELWQVGIAVCMDASGFDYPVILYTDDSLSDRIVNPLNATIAKSFGYHLPPLGSDLSEQMIPTDEKFAKALSGGDSGGGCGERAYKYAYGFPESVQFWDNLDAELARIEEQVFIFDTTSEHQDLMTSWSSCMDESGYSYISPFEANTEFSGSEEITDKEIRVRITDLECDERIGLTASRSTFEQERLLVALDENSSVAVDLQSSAEGLRRNLSQRLVDLRAIGIKVFGAL